jgi:hypothetical protein
MSKHEPSDFGGHPGGHQPPKPFDFETVIAASPTVVALTARVVALEKKAGVTPPTTTAAAPVS